MKTTEEIYEEMKADYAGRTGLAVTDGGDMSVRLYAVAAQLYTLWVQAEFLRRQAFPQSAEGTYLDYHAQVRGLERAKAVKATGALRFTVDEAGTETVTIPAGTACMTAAEREFITTEAGAIPAGSLYCDVAAQAVEAGVGGNVPAESVIYMELAPTGVSGCYNPAAFTGGADAEADEALRGRVVASYRTMPNGANAAYYKNAAMSVDGVAAVAVLPKVRGAGTVDVAVTNATGAPSEALVSAVQAKLDSQREICVDIDVYAPETVTVDVTASVTAAEGYAYASVAGAVESALEGCFNGQRLGENVYLAKLGSIIYAVEGVENYAITSPGADIAVTAAKLPVLGSVTLTDGEA